MKANQPLLIVSLLFVFLINNGTPVLASASTDMISNTQKIKTTKKKLTFKKHVKKVIFKIKKKVTSFIDDGPTLVISMAAIILGIYGIYYFFSIGYIWGLLAFFAMAFFLYLLFTYLNY